MSSSHDDPLADVAWPAPPAPNEHVSSAIRQRCTEGLCPRRGPTRARRLMSACLATVVVATLVLIIGTRGLPHGTLFAVLGWALVYASVLAVGLFRPPGRRVSRGVRLAIALALPLAFFVYLTWTGVREGLTWGQALDGWRAMSCGVHALLFSGLITAASLLVWRGTDPCTPGLSGVLVGLAGGLVSATVVDVVCPTRELGHLWIVHGGMVLLLMALGWVAGRRWLPP